MNAERALLLLLVVASCGPADAEGTKPIPDYEQSCMSWPRETKLQLPAEAADVVRWHDAQWVRGRYAHDDCRDKYNALRLAIKRSLQP